MVTGVVVLVRFHFAKKLGSLGMDAGIFHLNLNGSVPDAKIVVQLSVYVVYDGGAVGQLVIAFQLNVAR